MSFLEQTRSKKKPALILALIIALMLTTVYVSSTLTAYGATIDYWQVKLGDETLALVETEQEAQDLIGLVENYYMDGNEGAVLVSVEPAMSVEKVTVKMVEEQPELTQNPEVLLLELLEGESDQWTYVVEEGDTFWDISIKTETDIDTILATNPGTRLDTLLPGDELVFGSIKYAINVTNEMEVQTEREIPFETVYEDTDELYEGEEEVSTEGVLGKRNVTELVTYVNGVKTAATELSSEEVEAPVTEVILRGTKEKEVEVVETQSYADTSDTESSTTSTYEEASYSEPASYSGANAIFNAAYSQLGYGQDCTALVSNSLQAAGIYFHGWPEDYAVLGSWTNNPQPGDICIYSGHVAIYAGGGQAIHGGWNGGTTALYSVYCSNPLIGYIRVN